MMSKGREEGEQLEIAYCKLGIYSRALFAVVND